MSWYAVNYSVDRNYSTYVNADSEEEAKRIVENGEHNDEWDEIMGEEFLHVNNTEKICDGDVPCIHIRKLQGFGEGFTCGQTDELINPDECNVSRECYEPDFN